MLCILQRIAQVQAAPEGRRNNIPAEPAYLHERNPLVEHGRQIAQCMDITSESFRARLRFGPQNPKPAAESEGVHAH